LDSLVTEANLAKLAGDKSFARGAGYFSSGAVADLVQTRDSIRATVTGNDDYRVMLKPEGRALAWSCTCPLGEEGTFCKHAVAAGLAWLAREGKGGDELAGVRAHLATESRESLVEMLVEQAGNDPHLRARLESASLQRDPPRDMTVLKAAVNKAFAVPGFVGYYNMRAFLARAEGVEKLLCELLKVKRPADAVELAHYALRRGIAAYKRIDDSGGAFGENLRQLAALHLEICRAANPEPEALGKQLFRLQMLDDWGFFKFEDYAPLLAKQGLARYRSLAEAQWKKVPALAPGDKRDYGDGRTVIAGIMAALARHAGDTDALVAVMARDLSHPYHFLEIAECLTKAGRHTDALAWAERGHKAFAQKPDSRLVDFLADAYHRAKRDPEAIALTWAYFTTHLRLDAYQRLERCSGRAEAWKTWREKALAHIRAELRRPDRKPGPWDWSAAGHTLLVEIFLHENDSDAALAEANCGGCTSEAWMQLAQAREEDHPSDAAAIYRRFIDATVNQANNRAYDEAAELAATIKALMHRAGQKKDFAEWLAALRVKHKAKRNFMQRISSLN
jgi:uncharacterized Zn finger protein